MPIHLVYPFDPAIHAAPWSIGNNLTAQLEAAGHRVVNHDWLSKDRIWPCKGDILLGHPALIEGCAFLDSLKEPGWAKKIALAPFNASPRHMEWYKTWVPRVDKYLAICGPYWDTRIPIAWLANTSAIDMACDASDHPRVKASYSVPGSRKVVFIGCTEREKGADFLHAVSKECPYPICHVGYGQVGAYVEELGRAKLWGEPSPWGAWDILIVPGRNDANPTVVLEACLRGLITIGTHQSGWGSDVMSELFACGDVDAALRAIERWELADGALLQAESARLEANARLYTWKRFAGRVLSAI